MTNDYGTDWVDEPQLAVDGEGYISASRIKKWRECPEKFRFRYHSDKSPTKISKGYKELGSAVHEAIENVLQSDTVNLGSQSHLTTQFKREYRSMDPPIDKSMYEDGLDYLEVAARYVAANEPNIIGIEEEVVYSLGRSDIESNIKAIIDVCTEDEIWDWKTGRVRDDTEMQEKIQGAVYMKAYEYEFGHAPERIQFVYLKEEAERTYEPSDSIWDEMIEHAANLVRGVSREEFEARPGDNCYWCGWEQYCSASPTGVGDIDYHKF